MKQLLLILLSAFPFVSSAQGDNPYKYFVMTEQRTVNFEAIYEMPGLTANEIKDKILTEMPSKPGISEVRENSSGITAVLDRYISDYRSLGYSRMGAHIFLSMEKWGNISVSVKDGKYRVVLTNVIANKKPMGDPDYNKIYSNYRLESIILKLNKSGWATSKKSVKPGKDIEEDFYRLFDFTKSQDSDW